MAVFASDDFEGTEGTELSSYNSAFQKVTGYTGSMEIASGRIRPSSTTSARYYHTTAPGSADYSVSGDVYSAGIGGNKQVQLLGRCQSGANTAYRVGIYPSTITQCTVQLYKFVSGTATQLGSTTTVTQAVGDTLNLKLEMIGSASKVYHNGSEIISVTDSAITAAGYAGVGSYADTSPSDSVGAHLASFSADEVSSGQTGTGSLTTATETISGTGVIGHTGTGALTASEVTLSGAGTLTHTGIGSLTTLASVVAGTGVITHIGTGALTTTAVTVDGSGTVTGVGITGSGALTLGNVTTSGSGVLTHTGTGSLVLQVTEASGTGTVIPVPGTVTGTGDLTITGITASGSGVIAHTGAGDLSLSSVTLSGGGSLTHTGTGALAVSSVLLSGTGGPVGVLTLTQADIQAIVDALMSDPRMLTLPKWIALR